MQKSFPKQAPQQRHPRASQPDDERFKLVARATNDVFWDWDLETNAAWRSEGASETFGYPSNEQVSDVNFWINRIHPEDRVRVDQILHKTEGFLTAFKLGLDRQVDNAVRGFPAPIGQVSVLKLSTRLTPTTISQ